MAPLKSPVTSNDNLNEILLTVDCLVDCVTTLFQLQRFYNVECDGERANSLPKKNLPNTRLELSRYTTLFCLVENRLRQTETNSQALLRRQLTSVLNIVVYLNCT
jgi:hypothetical protein